MLNVGIIGLGKMGQRHKDVFAKTSGATVTALAEADEDRLEEVLEAHTGQNQPEGFTDAEEMMDEADVDAVAVCLPTPLHPDLCKAAFERDLHVLCEKPMALNSDLCEEVLEAAENSGGLFMVAHCVRFWPEYVYLKETIESGRFGELYNLMMWRASAPPTWSADDWLLDNDKSGGPILDLHIHDVDFAQFLLGQPDAIYCTADGPGENAYGTVNAVFAYEDGPSVSIGCDQMLPESYPFEMRYSATFEKGCLTFTTNREPGLMEFTEQGQEHPHVKHGDGYTEEISYFVECIENNEAPAVCPPQSSAQAVRLVEAEKESIRSGDRTTL